VLKKKEFLKALDDYSDSTLYYLDESGFDLTMSRLVVGGLLLNDSKA
jgi:hypothetical protein